jgi:hypothetical protein
MYESDDKMVSHPGHYQGANGMEVIDVIEAFTANLTGIEATDTGNIIKYACRWKEKGGVQDLKKIVWYATHLIEKLEGKTTLAEEALTDEQEAKLRDFIDWKCRDVVFPTRDLARKVLDGLRAVIDLYGFTTVQDFADMAEVSFPLIELSNRTAYGWVDLDNAYVETIEHNYFKLILPQVIKVKEKESN